MVVDGHRVKLEFHFPMLMLQFERPAEWMHGFGRKHERAVRALGSISVLVGMVGMVVAGAFLFRGAIEVAMGGPAQIGVVIPGVKVPGSPVYIPLLEGLIVIFFLAAFHEGMHGIVAAAEGLKPKYAAFILFLFIPAAGVELDEEKLKKKSRLQKMRIFAAGSMGNFLLALLSLALLLPAGKVAALVVEPAGLRVLNSSNPAISAGEVIVSLNGREARSTDGLRAALEGLGPGERVVIGTLNGSVEAFLNGEGKIGVYLEQELNYKNPLGGVALFVMKLLGLSISLNIGVGLMNLLPLGILDGGRMFREAVPRWYPQASALVLLLLLVNIIGPILL